jgi:acetyl-CoA C-acetyltransferase
VTAGNAPGLNGGAALTLVLSESYAMDSCLQPRAWSLGHVSLAGEPTSSAYLPPHAIHRPLRATSLKLDDIVLIEIDEAFAAVPAVNLRVLADGDSALLESLDERTNVNGGADAILLKVA